MSRETYLTSKQAAAQLGVSMATLYAYVSRGLIRSEEMAGQARERRYLAEDVQALVDRKTLRKDPTRAAQDALHWGTPVLESALTLIAGGHLYYRGQDACQLAQKETFEEVAAWLWTEQRPPPAALFATPVTFDDVAPQGSPILAMQAALASAAECDVSAYTLTPENVAQTGAHILQRLALTLTRTSTLNTTIAAALAEAWRVPRQTRLLDAALILCADHELNASSFTARVIASAEATPYEVVMGGLAALTGFRHGGQTRRVAAFMREIEQARDIRASVGARLQRGEELPGFGHRLYPSGDPRAALLLSLLEHSGANAASIAFARHVMEEVRRVTGRAPTIDFALAALERALRLPSESAIALFGLGRTAGWIAHALEQYGTHQLIRPRATYIGRQPASSA